MTNDNLLDRQEDIADIQPNLSGIPNPAETKRIGLGWRIIIAAVSLVIIVFLAYPLIQKRSQPTPNKDNLSSESQTVLTAPQATVQANPNSAKAQFDLGNAYVQAEQWTQAMVAYQKAIELDPNYQAAYANLGVVYYQQAQFDLAASQYEKALELNPNDGEVAYNLGALYLQQALMSDDQVNPNLLKQAITQLEQVRELTPDLAEPYFGLGVAYSILNRKEDAIQAFEAFLARDSGQDPRASQEAQRYLENLRGE
jgi:tetratricopeptide (TPR) repeat protein